MIFTIIGDRFFRMPHSYQQLGQRDLNIIWHPCTQMHDHENVPMIAIRKARGVWLEDYNGKRYLDAISSWWVNLFGHNNPRITKALQDQIEQLSQVIFAGFTHEPAVLLAEQLIAATPPGLSRCFYADNGSSAIEVALKMSFHYWVNSGEAQKTKFINLSNSYHGETLGALAVGDVDLYKQTYAPLLMGAITVPSPDCYYRDPGESWESYSTRAFAKMEGTLAQHAHEVCAVIIEPLVQCAGNMRMYHPVYLKLLREACDRYNVHLIADEIAVGFGRTGTLFACEQAQITPDFLCLSKGITGGYLPLSVVLTHENIYQAFYAEYHQQKAFLHSHSYTGNALACRAALATLEIFKTEPVLENNQKLAQHFQQATNVFLDHPHVGEVRQTGMIIAIEMEKNKKTREAYDWKERRGLRVYQYALEHGVVLRPLGNVVYFMPPYVITTDEIDYLIKIAHDAIDFATAG
jgi:adenosylmethionine-8-amino-7-oxononanoate aminotransferase